MDPLSAAFALGLAMGQAPVIIVAEPHGAVAFEFPWAPYIAEAARRFAIPESCIRTVIETESSNVSTAVSPKGAMGLMQLMPATYAEMRLRYGLGRDPFDSHDNIVAGTAYLREMLDRYGAPGFLVAYNAGPKVYAGIVTGVSPMPDETRAFLSELRPRIGFGDAEELFYSVAARHNAWSNEPSWRKIFVVAGP
jgi:soluble lytic murein transglycosylase-like protein